MNEDPLILLVDDEEKNLQLLEAILSPRGYRIVKAQSGEECLKILAREKGVSLILLDVMMPDKNGFEVCREIKENEKTKFIPVVLVTGLKEKEDKIKGLESGADDFLSKPVDRNEIVARVKSLIRIKMLYDELQNSYIKLNELQGLKDDLSRMIAHDINNVLMLIDGNLYLIKKKFDQLPDAIKGFVADAKSGVNELVDMVADFMDIEKMEENKLTLRTEKTHIGELVLYMMESVKPMLQEAGITIHAGGSGMDQFFYADKNLMLRVMKNLVINSVKHTPQGGAIEVCADANENEVKISVKDNGAGIAPEFKDKIFEKYSQVEVKRKNFGRGRGLGLAFCKLAVSAHGGKIWVESEGLDKGSIFIFAVPRSLPQSPK